jgi:hypothetical protein
LATFQRTLCLTAYLYCQIDLLDIGDIGNLSSEHIENPMVLVTSRKAAGMLHTKDEGAVLIRALREILDSLDELYDLSGWNCEE